MQTSRGKTPPKHSKYSELEEILDRLRVCLTAHQLDDSSWVDGRCITFEQAKTAIDTLLTKEKAQAELVGRRKSYQDIFHLHMAHDWNETSGDLKDWLTKELHEITRLEAQLTKEEE